MAKTITDEVMKLTIEVNGNSAQQELFKLEKSTRSLNQESAALRLEKKKLERQGKEESDRYKEITRTLRENSAEVKKNKERMAELQKQIGLTGLTLGQLESRAKMVRSTLRNLIPGSADHQRYTAELKQLTNRLDEVRGRAQAAKLSLSSIADGFNKYAALGATITAFFAGVVLSLQKIVDINGKLSDAQSKVMKTTGMTRQEVDELTKSFGVFKTRTTRIDLLGIAEIGGRLGIAKEEIKDFVVVMNKASVALGDSFEGGPDVVAEKLGRIKGLYEELKNASVESAFEATGSALNELGAAGTASEANMADFVTRVGSMTEALKPAISEALGLGAAFEESGLNAEIAGNNYGKLLSIAARDFPKFAKVMGMAESKVKELLKNDPTEFFLQFAASLKGMDGIQMAQTLDYLKLNDQEVSRIVSAAANNIDRFRDKMRLASVAMAESTSMTKEYDIVNNNLAATLDKIRKTVMGWFSSETLVKWLAEAFEWIAKLIGATEDAEGSVTGWRNSLLFLLKILTLTIVSVLSYKAGLQLAALWSGKLREATLLSNIVFKAQYALLVLKTIAVRGLALAWAVLTLNVTRTRTAWTAFSVALGSNPFGALLAVIGAVVSAMILFKNTSKDISNELKTISSTSQILAKRNEELEKSFAKSSADLKNKIEPLIRILNNQNTHLETRKQAYQQLIAISPDFIGSVNKEFLATEKLNTVYASLLDKLKQKLRAEANQKVMAEFYENEAKAVSDLVKIERELATIRSKADESREKEEAMESGSEARMAQQEKSARLEVEYNRKYAEALNARKKLSQSSNDLKYAEDWRSSEIARLEGILKTLKVGTEKYIATKNELLSLLGNVETDNDVNPKRNFNLPGDDKKDKKSKEEAKRRLEELKREAAERLRLERELEDSILANMEDNYQKQWQIEQANYTRKIEDLKNQLTSELEIQAAYTKSRNKNRSAEERNFYKLWADEKTSQNKHVYGLLENQERAHQLRLKVIQENDLKEKQATEKEAYELERTLRETEFNNQLAALGENEKTKADLRREFEAEELKAQEEFLLKQIEQLKTILSEGVLDGFDFSLFSEEEKTKLESQVVYLENAISKLQEAKNKKTNDGARELDLGLGSQNDILGYSQGQWDLFFQNIAQGTVGLETMSMAIGAMQQMWTSLDSYLVASESAQLRNYERNSDTKKRKLKNQLDNGQINQAQYKRAVEAMDAETDRKKAEIEYKQAKRQKVIAAMNVLTSTAQAIMSIWAQVPKFDFGATAGILTGVVSAMGALQLATVLKTPLPTKGYEEGLYPDYVDVVREQDGKKFRPKMGGKLKSGLVTQNTLMVAEGNKPEMIIDNKAWSKLNPGLKDSLIRELRGVKGFENGYYKDGVLYTGDSGTKSNPPSQNQSNDELLLMMFALISENTELLREWRDAGFTSIVSSKDYKSIKEMHDALERYRQNREKAKV